MNRPIVIPAQAGIQAARSAVASPLDSRFRGNDKKIISIILLSLLAFVSSAAEPQLPVSNDTYEVSWREYELGDGTVTLEKTAKPNCYRYRSETNPAGLVKMFYGAPSETSEFCIESARVRPRHFEFSGSDDDSYALDFNWKARKLKGGTLPERPLPADGIDHFSIQQAVRLWAMASIGNKKSTSLKLTLMEKDSQIPYRFALGATETIEVPAGSFDTVRVDLIDDAQREIHYWFAPGRDWSLVKLERRKNRKQQLMLVLK